jgi:hypothetical protein
MFQSSSRSFSANTFEHTPFKANKWPLNKTNNNKTKFNKTSSNKTSNNKKGNNKSSNKSKLQTPSSFVDNQNQKRRSKIKFADEIALHMQKGTKETAEFEKIMAECAAVMGPLDVHRRARDNLGI